MIRCPMDAPAGNATAAAFEEAGLTDGTQYGA
jgi:hypothetical protein